jgi:glycosyltransferase involved in cell wall biosynthesis
MKALFLATDTHYFMTHRLPVARALRRRGMEVLVMGPPCGGQAAVEQEGFRFVPWRISRGSINPFREVRSLIAVTQVYRMMRPNVVHHAGLKAVLHGALAAKFCGGIRSVNVITGLGHVFTSPTRSMRLLRRVVVIALRYALSGQDTRTIFHNPESRDVLVACRVSSSKSSVVIRGSGVDITEFWPRPEPTGLPVVLLASRMLWDKGVGDFVKAALQIRGTATAARFVLVGGPDGANPNSIPEAQLSDWTRSGVVEWWGLRSDMPLVFAQANLVCFPSYYGEGVPKVLLEAAASGRAIVTTDVPGCREVVRHGENGFLVPPRNPQSLAEAISTLLGSPALRARMGLRGREIATTEFSEERVVKETIEVYRELVGAEWPGGCF